MSMLRKEVLVGSFILGLAMVLIAGDRGMAQEKESELKRLMLADFETPIKSAGLPQSTKHVKEGEYSGKWENIQKNIIIHNKPTDLSKYDVISFWIYSEVANKQSLCVLCYSQNNNTPGSDYYYHRFYVGWTGWKRFLLPIKKLWNARSPLGLNKIDTIMLSPIWGGKEVKPDTVLYLDKIELISIPESVDI